MEDRSYLELLDLVKLRDFTCFMCIYQLSLHGDNVGIQHFLIDRLYRFPYSEVEFFIPQLIQLIVSFETESMALRDFILNYSARYPHFCLIAFWTLQAYVFELKNEPDSYSFHTVRQFVNSLQNIMFNQSQNSGDTTPIRENLHPALLMCAMIVSSFSHPQIHDYAKPLIISQGKQEKSLLFRLANFHKTLTKNLTLKNKGTSLERLERRLDDSSDEHESDSQLHKRFSESMVVTGRRVSRASSSLSAEYDRDYSSDYTHDHAILGSTSLKKKPILSKKRSEIVLNQDLYQKRFGQQEEDKLTSHSMPELMSVTRESSFDVLTPTLSNSSSTSLGSSRRLNEIQRLQRSSFESSSKLLQVNYFKKETELMMILQNISSRLSQVPKEARLSTLRAELTILNNSLLPSQVDIPQLLPTSSMPNKRYHRILKVNVNEACVLNSAERVPYLLLIEYLSEDLDFDPSSKSNKGVLDSDGKLKSSAKSQYYSETDTNIGELERHTSVDETDLGDISVVALSNEQSHFLNHLRARMSERFGERSSSSYIRGVPLETEHFGKMKNADENTLSKTSTKDISSQVRIAALMLRQLEKSGHSNLPQSSAIKSRIIKSMKTLQDQFESIDYQQIKEISANHDHDQDAGERKLENDFKIGEDWSTKKARIRKTSPYGHLPNWDLCSVIVKNGDDLQQEAFACQLISLMSNIWRSHQVGVWTKPMKIVVTSYNLGLVETINNALSVHSIKKTMTELSIKTEENPKGTVASLKDYFLKVYELENSQKYIRAQENFARSLAAYSIICYVLQIKDRHNGNIMLDNEGHIIHIDFGFLLSNSPGSVGFEAAPFKLTLEYVDVLGGYDSRYYGLFKTLCKQAFQALRKESDQIVKLVELMLKDSSLPCFKNGPQTSVLLKQRFQLDLSDEECDDYVENYLIGRSIGSMYTRLYDQFQLLTQGIYS